MRRGSFKGRGIGFRGGGMRGFGRPYRGFWGRPFRPFIRWRPFWWYPLWWRPLYWMPWTLMMGGFIYLLYDSIAYKLYASDVDRIERDTGKIAKDLSEEELLTAMKHLGIQKLEIAPEDHEVISSSKQPVKELSREEIVAAMKHLGITKLEVTTEDQQVSTTPQTFGTSRFCIYCGNALPSNSLYCSKCGKKR